MDMPSQFEAGQDDVERFRSLTDIKWGEFESLGFGGLGQDKLQFDLNESARTVSTSRFLPFPLLIVCRRGARNDKRSAGTTFRQQDSQEQT